MAECPQCEAELDPDGSQEPGETCPQCGRAIGDSSSNALIDVARVANLAEAGFLSDELMGMGIDARVHQLDEFSAAGERWSSRYLIRVPSESAQDAADHVRQYLFEEEPGRTSTLDIFRSLAGRTSEPLSWRPVAVVVLAGVASFVLGQRFAADHPPRRPRQDALPSAVNAIGRPFTTEPTANQPQYRLSYDGRQQLWTLETDEDNDGVFESSQHFRGSSADR